MEGRVLLRYSGGCVVALLWVFAVVGLRAQTPVKEVGAARLVLRPEGQQLTLPYYSNLDPGIAHDNVERAVIVVHGTNRNADDYYARVEWPARFAGRADLRSIIIAPQFLVENDVAAHHLDDSTLFWSSGGWKRGDLSRSTALHPRRGRISSFAVIDTLLLRLALRNPNLRDIVISGHSAGGQFVNRFAAGSPMEPILREQYGIAMRYIVANPSSYLYFTAERRVEETTDLFAVPDADARQACPGYNRYKYGLEGLNQYMSRIGAENLARQYRQRRVIYLLGANDNDPAASSLDRSCPAMLQGEHRLERGRIYYNYLMHLFGAGIRALQPQATIPNVGHSSEQIFASACGKYFLFDYGQCDHITAAAAVAPPPAGALTISSIYPNPVQNEAAIYFALPRPAPVTAQLYDLLGRPVRTLLEEAPVASGKHAVYWDGRDELGRPVPAGMYFFRVSALGRHATIRLIFLRPDQ